MSEANKGLMRITGYPEGITTERSEVVIPSNRPLPNPSPKREGLYSKTYESLLLKGIAAK
jgi:hypothetical protein